MVFSSVTFLAFFLPCLLAFYFAIPSRFRSARNLVLLVFSIIFYSWGGLRYLLLLFCSILINYIGGVFSGSAFGQSVRKCAHSVRTARKRHL